jgi:hypothetical protein
MSIPPKRATIFTAKTGYSVGRPGGAANVGGLGGSSIMYEMPLYALRNSVRMTPDRYRSARGKAE